MKTKIPYIYIILLIAAIVCSWIFYPNWLAIVYDFSHINNQNNYGTFGDSFGALNTLFSGLAFSGIIISIYLQGIELKQTRAEMKSQGEQFELQTKSFTRQTFENTFFQLLNLQNQIIQLIEVTHYGSGISSSKIATGRSAFKPLFTQKFCENVYQYELELSEDDLPSDINEAFLLYLEAYGDKLNNYFANIYQILKFIDDSEVDNKKSYSNILRAQLSSYELALLFFNCLCDVGKDKFKPLVEKYALFEHLPLLDGITDEEIKLYDISAYGKTNIEYIHRHEKI